MKSLLEIRNLRIDVLQGGKIVNMPLRGIDLEIKEGESLGVVGETGCGKTLTATSILGLLPDNLVQYGTIKFSEHGVLEKSSLAKIRGTEISMIFQNPQSSFNPIFNIGSHFKWITQRLGIEEYEAKQVVKKRLNGVGLQDTDRILKSFPHELSGGMLQRCMIALALIGSPKLLIADEPITALDATIGHQVLELIRSIQRNEGFSLLFISHDVSAVAKMSDTVAVLYAGKVVERGPASILMKKSLHPYTSGLLSSMPSIDKARGTLDAIKGTVPQIVNHLTGCAFRDRCPLADRQCEEEPIMRTSGAQEVACWKAHL